jgi:regulator of extracellular matrix RemA (YlzA/DUF370 family)
MGYLLPLNFVKVSIGRSDNRQFDVAVCATRIVAIMSTEIYQARKTIAAEKKNGTLINAAGTNKAKSAVFLDNGSVIASPLSVKRLMSLIEKANNWQNNIRTRKTKVYDIENGPEEIPFTDEYDEDEFDEEEDDD